MRGQASERVDGLAIEERRLERELAGYPRELQNLAKPATGQDVGLAARLADLQERIRSSEQRLIEVRDEAERLRHDLIDEVDVSRALAEFDPVWQVLAPHEQARLLRLQIERIDYDGLEGTISITFHAEEALLFLPRVQQGADPISESQLRPIVTVPDRGKQRRLGRALSPP